MGRGRAKAKQTKVARDLKYRSQGTDLSALARELRGDPPVVDEDDPDVAEAVSHDRYVDAPDDAEPSQRD